MLSQHLLTEPIYFALKRWIETLAFQREVEPTNARKKGIECKSFDSLGHICFFSLRPWLCFTVGIVRSADIVEYRTLHFELFSS
jgi:hypothetical protein